MSQLKSVAKLFVIFYLFSICVCQDDDKVLPFTSQTVCSNTSTGESGICIFKFCIDVESGLRIGHCNTHDSVTDINSRKPVSFHKDFNLGKPASSLKRFNHRKPASLHKGFNQTRPVSLIKTFDQRVPMSLHKKFDQRLPISLHKTFDQRKPVTLHETFDQRKPVTLHETFDQRKPVTLHETFDQRTPVKLHETFDQRKPVALHETFDLRKPVALHETFDLRKPVALHETFDLRKPVALHETFDLRKPVALHETFDLRKPVALHETFDLRKPVALHETFDLRKPVALHETFDLRKPVTLHETFDLRKPVPLNEDHDQRWPVLKEDSHDGRIPIENTFALLEKSETMDTSSKLISSTLELLKMNNTLPQNFGLSNISKVCGRRKITSKGLFSDSRKSNNIRWPWLISLHHYEEGSSMQTCGGVLLNSFWVMTAAHCVYEISSQNLLLHLGGYFTRSGKLYPNIERSVYLVVVHPEFDSFTFENDLALLRLKDPVQLKENIAPICFSASMDNVIGRIAVVAGWKKIDEGGELSPILHEVYVPILSNTECEDMYYEAGYVLSIEDIFVCAGLTFGGLGECEGNSGAPMIVKKEGQWVLVGLLSWGINCAAPKQPDVYIRISEFTDWINQIIVY